MSIHIYAYVHMCQNLLQSAVSPDYVMSYVYCRLRHGHDSILLSFILVIRENLLASHQLIRSNPLYCILVLDLVMAVVCVYCHCIQNMMEVVLDMVVFCTAKA